MKINRLKLFAVVAIFQYIHDVCLVRASEYCFQVPANRFGHGYFSAARLKIIQEVITLVVFGVFAILYLKEDLNWNYVVSFLFILGAVFFAFKQWN